MKTIKDKTWKREVAFLVFLWMIYLSVYGVEALKLVVVPGFTFMGLAFGMEWYSKDEIATKVSRKQTIEDEPKDGDTPTEDHKDLRGGA